MKAATATTKTAAQAAGPTREEMIDALEAYRLGVEKMFKVNLLSKKSLRDVEEQVGQCLRKIGG